MILLVKLQAEAKSIMSIMRMLPNFVRRLISKIFISSIIKEINILKQSALRDLVLKNMRDTHGGVIRCGFNISWG